jgi:hypothetical protein
MGQGIILVLISIQKWDTGFSGEGGILNFEPWYPSWILRKIKISDHQLNLPEF